MSPSGYRPAFPKLPHRSLSAAGAERAESADLALAVRQAGPPARAHRPGGLARHLQLVMARWHRREVIRRGYGWQWWAWLAAGATGLLLLGGSWLLPSHSLDPRLAGHCAVAWELAAALHGAEQSHQLTRAGLSVRWADGTEQTYRLSSGICTLAGQP